jgi:hypothetical protein
MTDVELEELLELPETPEERAAFDELPGDPESVLEQGLKRAEGATMLPKRTSLMSPASDFVAHFEARFSKARPMVPRLCVLPAEQPRRAA